MKKIVFLSSDTGGGHRAAVNAIISALDKSYPREYNAKIIEFFQEGNKQLDKIIKDFYSGSIKGAPIGYSMLFHITNNRIVWNALHPIYELVYKNIKEKILQEKPDMIVSVHPLVNYITRKILTELNLSIPFIIVITDPVTIHLSWIEPGADFSIVATEEAKNRLLKYDVDERKIRVMGLPINPVFYEHSKNTGEIRKHFGLKNKFCVLFTGGGEGGGKILPIIKSLLKEKLDIEIIAVCGRNEKLKKSLSKFPIEVLGYTNKMRELMSVADLMVAKAGPGIIEESVTKGLPIVITSYVPGQEKGNIEYAKKRTRAYYENNTKKVVALIKKEFLEGKGKLKKIPKSEAPVYKIAKFIGGLLK